MTNKERTGVLTRRDRWSESNDDESVALQPKVRLSQCYETEERLLQQ